MTPKEKAKELFDKFARIDGYQDSIDLSKCDYEKQCALIAVDFAMNSKYSFQPMHGGWISGKLYYEEVKKEIEKL